MVSRMTVTELGSTGTDSAAVDVVRAVAKHRGTEPNELPPIDEYVDGDAICRLFGRQRTSMCGLDDGSLSFRYAGVFVRMTHDGMIVVSDPVGGDDVSVGDDLLTAHSAGYQRCDSPEEALEIATLAIDDAEECVWAVASDCPDGRLADQMYATVEQIWAVQGALRSVSGDFHHSQI